MELKCLLYVSLHFASFLVLQISNSIGILSIVELALGFAIYIWMEIIFILSSSSLFFFKFNDQDDGPVKSSVLYF